MTSSDEESTSGSRENWWVLIPLTALMIPVIAVASTSTAISASFAVALVLVVVGLIARSLMSHNHKLKLAEMRAQEVIARLERDQLEQANRVIDHNADLRELRAAIRHPNADESSPSSTAPETVDDPPEKG